MKKSIFSLGMLGLASQVNAQESFEYLDMVSCSGQGQLCTDNAVATDFAKYQLQNYLSPIKYQTEGQFRMVFYSESLNQSHDIQFHYQVEQINVLIGEDRDQRVVQSWRAIVSHKSTTLLSPYEAELAESVLSSKRSTAKTIELLNLPSNDGSTIDIDGYCNNGQRTKTRDPYFLNNNCSIMLGRSGLWNLDEFFTRKAVIEKELNGGANANIASNTYLVNEEAGAHTGFRELQKATLEFGGALEFTSPDGYAIVLVPDLYGNTKVKRFVVPPNNVVPVDEKGNILDDQMKELLRKGKVNFEQETADFALYLGNRYNSKKLIELGKFILPSGYNPGRVTIADL